MAGVTGRVSAVGEGRASTRSWDLIHSTGRVGVAVEEVAEADAPHGAWTSDRDVGVRVGWLVGRDGLDGETTAVVRRNSERKRRKGLFVAVSSDGAVLRGEARSSWAVDCQ